MRGHAEAGRGGGGERRAEDSGLATELSEGKRRGRRCPACGRAHTHVRHRRLAGLHGAVRGGPTLTHRTHGRVPGSKTVG